MYRERPLNDAKPIQFTIAATILAVAFFIGVHGTASWDASWWALFAGAAVGFLFLVWRVQQHDERAWEIIEEQKEQTKASKVQNVVIHDPGPEFVLIENDKCAHYIRQPKPGAFDQFVRDAVSEGNRIQFSKRQAMERGWTDKEYAIMTLQLQDLNWISEQLRNGAPMFRTHKKDEIYDWLREERAQRYDSPHSSS